MVTLSALEAQRLLVALGTAELWVDPFMYGCRICGLRSTEEQRAWAREVRRELTACRRILRRRAA